MEMSTKCVKRGGNGWDWVKMPWKKHQNLPSNNKMPRVSQTMGF